MVITKEKPITDRLSIYIYCLGDVTLDKVMEQPKHTGMSLEIKYASAICNSVTYCKCTYNRA